MKVAVINQPWDIVQPPIAAGGSLVIWAGKVIERIKDDVELVVYSRRSYQQSLEEQCDGVLYCRVPVDQDEKILKGLKLVERVLQYPRPKRPLFSSPIYYHGYISKVTRDLRRRQCDIVHIFNFSQFAPIVRRLNPHAKIVLHMHCEWLDQLDYKMVDEQLSKIDLVIGCSEHITDAVRRRFPRFANICHTIFNGCEIDQSEADADGSLSSNGTSDKRLLFVGRVSPEKGVHVLLKAFPKIVAQCPHTQLDIVGSVGSAPYEYMALISDDDKVKRLATYYDNWLHRGDYEKHLTQLIPSQMADRINFIGMVPHAETAAHYAHADIVINPSLTEAFGMTVVEAMIRRKPVVAANVGGMKEIVQNGENGVLVDADDPDALANAIIVLLQNDELCRAMGEQGQRSALNRFTWDRTATDLLQLYGALS